MNLYKLPTPNPTPKPIRHWGLDKSYKIVRVRLYKFVQISHLIKYAQIGREIASGRPLMVCHTLQFETFEKINCNFKIIFFFS